MSPFEQGLLLTEFADQSIAKGVWCGHMYLQKTVFFLQELLHVDLGLEYVLYKGGLYSFDLEAALMWCQATHLLEKEYSREHSEHRLKPTATSQGHRSRFPRLLQKPSKAMAFVVEKLGAKNVVELEKLATALGVTRELGKGATATQRVKRIRDFKPHISLIEAKGAVDEFDQIASEHAKRF